MAVSDFRWNAVWTSECQLQLRNSAARMAVVRYSIDLNQFQQFDPFATGHGHHLLPDIDGWELTVVDDFSLYQFVTIPVGLEADFC